MPKYLCNYCFFETKLKSNYLRHLATQKHLDNYNYFESSQFLFSDMDEDMNISMNQDSQDINTYKCKVCHKRYKYSQGLSKHIRNAHGKKNNIIEYIAVGKEFVEYGEPRTLEYKTIHIEKTS